MATEKGCTIFLRYRWLVRLKFLDSKCSFLIQTAWELTPSCACADAYSVKHITYKWRDGPTKSVSLADEVQLPQVQVKGYRVKEKLEVLSTGQVARFLMYSIDYW